MARAVAVTAARCLRPSAPTFKQKRMARDLDMSGVGPSLSLDVEVDVETRDAA